VHLKYQNGYCGEAEWLAACCAPKVLSDVKERCNDTTYRCGVMWTVRRQCYLESKSLVVM
jgi:hypothetical protein